MSNPECAKLYERIIDDVIAESRQDFEDSGIDEQTLLDLRNVWRERLSATAVCHFSWDNEVKAADDGEAEGAELGDGGSLGVGLNVGEDLSVGGGAVNVAAEYPDMGTGYGYSAAGSVDSGLQLPQGDLVLPQSGAAEGSNGVDGVDGVGGVGGVDSGIVLPGGGSSSADGAGAGGAGAGGAGADGSVNAKLGQSDGALPEVLREVLPEAVDGQEIEFTMEVSPEELKRLKKKMQKKRHNQLRVPLHQADGVDGGDDSDLGSDLGVDSDEINSDLDDPDSDEINSDEDEDGEQNIMLCLYDRVQRVRNRWKCNLKDGVANIDGKDYAFQKATGDSEW